MEETVRRTLPRRTTASCRRKSKRVYDFRMFRKIFRQLVVSGIILICILSIRNSNTPLAKYAVSKINSYLSSNVDLSLVYKNMNNFLLKLNNWGKAPSQPNLKKEVIPENKDKKVFDSEMQTQVPSNEEKSNVLNEEPEIKSNGAGFTSEEIKAPLASSLNSSDMDIKNIKSNYKLNFPVKGLISSAFGLRVNPITNKEEFHPGVDIKANQGSTIVASIAGNVIEARRGQTFGNFIRIQSGRDIVTTYGHCYRLLVKRGQKVSKGQKIAEVGNTGMSLGAHLHFEIWRLGRPVDPLNFFKNIKFKKSA